MATVIVSGSGGLVGSSAAEHFARIGFDVVGIENDMRSRYFGEEASTAATTRRLVTTLPSFRVETLDVRDADGLRRVFGRHRHDLELVIHTAAQPSHDWAARDPRTDFGVNAMGTLNMLEALRAVSCDTPFVFTSTNKVYGDHPNQLPLVDMGRRLELPEGHRYHRGIDTSMPIDRCTHSVFGVSKTSADLLVQEYGRYFGMPTVCFRGGCLTGPAHAGVELHGFLSYLMRCTVRGEPYTVHGHGGKQVRDNMHADDVASAFAAFHASPRVAAVYNLGGGRVSNCSVLEAIAACERIAGRRLAWRLSADARPGDHRWWISDMTAWHRDYPDWRPRHDLERMLHDIHDRNADRWAVC